MEFKLKESHRHLSDEELLADILRVTKELNKDTITTKEYMNNGGKFDYNTISRRFGSWADALNLCGIKTVRPSVKLRYKAVPREMLIADLKKTANKLNINTITTTEYDHHGLYNHNTFKRIFGSWENALISAGLNPTGYYRNISKEDLLFDIETMWVKLGRQPTCNDVRSGLSKYGIKSFYRHFGSWLKALEFFVSYMNGEQELQESDRSDKEKTIYAPFKIDTENEIVHKTKRDVNLRMRFLVMKRDDFKCCMCGRSPAITPGLELQIDHIIPWTKGGGTTIDNLQTLCNDCNLGKSNLSEIDE